MAWSFPVIMKLEISLWICCQLYARMCARNFVTWAPTQVGKWERGGPREDLTLITKDFEKNSTVSQKSGGHGHAPGPPSSEALCLLQSENGLGCRVELRTDVSTRGFWQRMCNTALCFALEHMSCFAATAPPRLTCVTQHFNLMVATNKVI